MPDDAPVEPPPAWPIPTGEWGRPAHARSPDTTTLAAPVERRTPALTSPPRPPPLPRRRRRDRRLVTGLVEASLAAVVLALFAALAPGSAGSPVPPPLARWEADGVPALERLAADTARVAQAEATGQGLDAAVLTLGLDVRSDVQLPSPPDRDAAAAWGRALGELTGGVTGLESGGASARPAATAALALGANDVHGLLSALGR